MESNGGLDPAQSSGKGTPLIVESAPAICAIVYDAVDVLLDLPMAGVITVNNITTPVIELASFCSNDWMADTQIDFTLDVLAHDMDHFCPDSQFGILRLPCTNKLIQLSNLRDTDAATYPSNAKPTRFIRKIGDDLVSKRLTSVGGIFHINSNHWVVAVADVESRKIYYGDSMAADQSPEQVGRCMVPQVLKWWLERHGFFDMSFATMEVCSQTDDFSCGIMSFMALAHYCLPQRYSLPHPLYAGVARVDLLRRIISLHLATSSDFEDSELAMFSTSPTLDPESTIPRPSTPLPSESMRQLQLDFSAHLSVSPMKPGRKRSRREEATSGQA
ncbi:hypothetical protein EUX98_g9154 [Antrodiella citrinella]|uniref:Ubiquitin-like protease family profile domain-containing protein n=1 Tax=Antrodiella citrinella TaxID=2447956 RepID=A0A4S4LYY3_9APHY|nr:hypothetical protein EUX98_g9154 [Antrodiella citrinella]